MEILFINACTNPQSRTHRLAEHILQKLDGTITEINLQQENIQPLNWEKLTYRSRVSAAGNFDDEVFKYAHRFAAADIIVIAAPVWDFSFPAMLKCFIEAINITGITFKYTANGPKGLCRAKKLIYAATSGGVIPEDNYGFGYIKSLASTLYGIPDIQFFKAEGLDIDGADVEAIMQRSLQEIDNSRL